MTDYLMKMQKIAKADPLTRKGRFPEGESVDVPEYLRGHGNPDAAEKWEEANEEYGDKLKKATEDERFASLQSLLDVNLKDDTEVQPVDGGTKGGLGSKLPDGTTQPPDENEKTAGQRDYLHLVKRGSKYLIKVSVHNNPQLGGQILKEGLSKTQAERQVQKWPKEWGSKVLKWEQSGTGATARYKKLSGVIPGVPDGTGPHGGTPQCQLSDDDETMFTREGLTATQGVPKQITDWMYVISKDNMGSFLVTLGNPKRGSSKIKFRTTDKLDLKDWVRDNVGKKISPNHVMDLTEMFRQIPKEWDADFVKMMPEKHRRKLHLANEMVKIPRQIGRLLSGWHSSGGDPIYQLSSTTLAGRPVPADVVDAVIDELHIMSRDPSFDSKDHRMLTNIEKQLERELRKVQKKAVDDDGPASEVPGDPRNPDGSESVDASEGTAVLASFRPLHEIAKDIRQDWKSVSYAAKPYLDAMFSLNRITDNYGSDNARSVVLYFLTNASQWRGPVAKAIKDELKRMIQSTGYRMAEGSDKIESRFEKMEQGASIKFKNKIFKLESPVKVAKMRPGQWYAAVYDRGRTGDVFKFLGFTDDDRKYGEGGVKFKTLVDLLRARGVRSVKALGVLQDESDYGHDFYMCGEWDTGKGCYLYLYGGRWCVGSGAQPVSFWTVTEARGRMVALSEEKWGPIAHTRAEDTDEIKSRFEEGVPADPIENMSPEDAAKWERQNEEHRDKFKDASHPRLDKRPPQILPLSKAKQMAKKLQKGDPDWEYRVVPQDSGKAIIEVYEGKHLLGKWAGEDRSATDLLERWGGTDEDEKEGKFEKGKPADPTKNMSPEDKAKWDKYEGDVEDLKVAGLEFISWDSSEVTPEGDMLIKGANIRVAATGLYGFTKAVQSDCESCARKLSRQADKIAKRIYAKDEKVATFLSKHAERNDSLSAKILVAAMKNIGPKLANDDPPEDPAVKKASKYSLYGFRAKTARLGLNACTEIRDTAGHLASDLHRRRAAKHARIVAFLEQHADEGKCIYSRMIRSSYPDADSRIASGPPTTVAEWLGYDVD